MDAALLGAMLREREGELSLLQQDRGAQTEELLHALAQLQAAHQGAEALRRKADALRGELGITRDELAAKDAELEALREQVCALERALAMLQERHRQQEEESSSGSLIRAGLRSFPVPELDAASPERKLPLPQQRLACLPAQRFPCLAAQQHGTLPPIA